MNDNDFTGGCQCGAVRYRFTERPSGAHICHCRMCQKAFGAFYAPLVNTRREHFEVTRGTIALFRSSDIAERGYCRDCGTPLSVADIGGSTISVSIGSLDHPEEFPPVRQIGFESRLPYANGLGQLPDRSMTEDDDPALAAAIRASNHQHPDHDTEDWHVRGR
jgi:hypothetical protein